jgi:hypothetical protein
MKKGQLMGQPLVFIFYIVAASLILLFGVKAFISLKCYDEGIEYHDFIRRFESKISTINNDAVGSKINLKDLHVPNTFKEICFFYNSENLDHVRSEKLKLLIQASVNQINSPNMFVYSPDACNDSELMVERIDDLNIDENFCEEVSDGSLDIVLESIPGEVNISKSI